MYKEAYFNYFMQNIKELFDKGLLRKVAIRNRLYCGLFFIGIFGLWFILWLAATGRFDLQRWLTPCGFKQQYNLPCPTCGMTTSAIAFSQGKILKAFMIQPAGALFCVVLLISAILSFIAAVFGIYFPAIFSPKLKAKYFVTALIIIIIIGWLVQLGRAYHSR